MFLTLHKKFIVVLWLFLFATSCEEFLDVNTDPDKTQQPSLNALLASSVYNTSQVQAEVAKVTCLYAQHLASPNASETDRYGPERLEPVWSMIYNTMTDLHDIILFSQEYNSPHYSGVAKILLAFNLGCATDLWGDIPYTEAFSGEQNLQPAYDSQQIIYEEIIRLLNEAVADLNKSYSKYPLQHCLLFDENRKQWKKFSYALMARYLNHLSKKRSYQPDVILQYVDSSFTSNDDDAQLFYMEGQENPWKQVVDGLYDMGILGGYLSQQFISSMKGETKEIHDLDPRLKYITDTIAGGDYAGTRNGEPPPKDGFCTLTYNSWYALPEAPVLLMTFSELKFIEAEVAFYAQDNERAFKAYINGIEAHMIKLGVKDNERAVFISRILSNISASSLSVRDILLQKWIALFLNPEAWTDVRRNNYQYPGMQPPANSFLGDTYIQRILYPESEMLTNRKNIPTGVSRADELWWNVNNGAQ